jgi:hypothetical protein
VAFQLQLPGGIKRTNPGPVDAYYTPGGGVVGYDDRLHACLTVPVEVRYDGLTVLITGVGEYQWLAPDFSNAGLTFKGNLAANDDTLGKPATGEFMPTLRSLLAFLSPEETDARIAQALAGDQDEGGDAETWLTASKDELPRN